MRETPQVPRFRVGCWVVGSGVGVLGCWGVGWLGWVSGGMVGCSVLVEWLGVGLDVGLLGGRVLSIVL